MEDAAAEPWCCFNPVPGFCGETATGGLSFPKLLYLPCGHLRDVWVGMMVKFQIPQEPGKKQNTAQNKASCLG